MPGSKFVAMHPTTIGHGTHSELLLNLPRELDGSKMLFTWYLEKAIALSSTILCLHMNKLEVQIYLITPV